MRPPKRLCPGAWTGITFLLLAGGCASGNGPLVPVHGQVAYQGIPLHAGTIVFSPDPLRGASGPIAVAVIEPDGTYALATGDQPGAAVGWYRVTVTANGAVSWGRAEGAYQSSQSFLPERYRDPDLSGLVREVKDGDNVIDFNLD